MAGIPEFGASFGALKPLDVRDPDLVLALGDTVAILDGDFRPRTLLRRLGPAAGFDGADDLTKRLADWIHPDDLTAVASALQQSRSVPGVDIEANARVRNDVDGWHTMTLVFRNLLEHPDVQGILVRVVDQTVFDREARWRTLVGATPIGIFEVDLDDRCTFVNAAFERLTGLAAHDALGPGWHEVVHAEDLAEMRVRRQIATAREEPCIVELRILRPDESIRWVSARSVPLRGVGGVVTGYLSTLEDTTERKVLEARLEHDATHDRLTGLGSRALLVEQMTAALARTRRGGPGVALLFIDLDGFKRVNDMLGHAAGDELLVQVASRLRMSVRESDVCVRLGGDEFVVCCLDVGSPAQSTLLAERLLAAIAEPYDVHGHEVLVGASIGIATAYGEDPVSVDQLLSNADIASYRAKRLGRGRFEIFDDELRRQLASGRRIARTVGRLLDEPVLPIVCQPIVHLENQFVVGFDCSVDWNEAHIDESPDVIAVVVEEAGMSRALDIALVRTILAQLAEWERRPPSKIVPGLSVALTRAGALSPVFPEMVRDMLARTRVGPSLCWLGVPEAAVAHDFEAASTVVSALDELGVGVALRDFGSSVSSLDHLRRLPTPTITVAGPLVEALHRDDSDAATATLLSAIVQYARALGRIVVAFGVQDEAHALRLRELGCSFGVGPASGAPLRPDQVEAFLQARSPAPGRTP